VAVVYLGALAPQGAGDQRFKSRLLNMDRIRHPNWGGVKKRGWEEVPLVVWNGSLRGMGRGKLNLSYLN